MATERKHQWNVRAADAVDDNFIEYRLDNGTTVVIGLGNNAMVPILGKLDVTGIEVVKT